MHKVKATLMDIVYLFKQDLENDSEELRYSLRSLKNLPHDKVFIVGEKPSWVKNVEFIEVSQTGTKYQNVMLNLLATVKNEQVSNDFTVMNDDFFIAKALPELPNLNFGEMQQVIAWYVERYPEGSGYIERMKMLYDALRERGIETPMSYELHVPMVFNKNKYLTLRDNMQGKRLFHYRTYYGNYYNLGGTPSKDCKIFLEPRHNDSDYNENPLAYLQNQSFLSVTGAAFRDGLPGDFVKKSFPDKSMYEL